MNSCCACLLFLFFGFTRALLEQEQTVDARFAILTQEVNKLQQTVASLQRQLASQNATQHVPVAFTAYLSQTITQLGSHQHVVFDNAITNVGNGYSHFSGHFTAPVRGVYVFFVVLTNIPGHSSSVKLLRNGQWIGHALAHGSDKDGGLFVTSTIAVTVELQQGDQVWVQNEYAFTPVEELDGGGWSSFCGHLVSTY